MKTLELTSRSTPTDPPRGYADTLALYDGTEYIKSWPCSCCPNPFRPSDREIWENCYAFIDFGELTGECVLNKKYRKCILLNGGGRVPTREPNPNHNGEKYAEEIFIHAGGDKSKLEWRGSKGCVTLNPIDKDELMTYFEVGEKCIIQIIPEQGESA